MQMMFIILHLLMIAIIKLLSIIYNDLNNKNIRLDILNVI